MSQIQLLSILKKELLAFVDELIELYPSEKDFLVIKFFLENQVPMVDVMNFLIEKILPIEHCIHSRDDKFFLENQVLFEQLRDKSTKVNYFKNMWTSDTVDNDDREMIWTWFEHFASIAKKYKHAS
jgi:hypothetical protein